MSPVEKYILPLAREWIGSLRLRPHPEGGYYRETHRSRAKLLSLFPRHRKIIERLTR
jgi:predicted cupin superfamily sugar epimerase